VWFYVAPTVRSEIVISTIGISMINCIYHPNGKMIVVDDDEYLRLLQTGEWFKHPKEAKEAGEINNEKVSIKKRRGRTSEQHAQAS
jgi:hypothetical protein